MFIPNISNDVNQLGDLPNNIRVSNVAVPNTDDLEEHNYAQVVARNEEVEALPQEENATTKSVDIKVRRSRARKEQLKRKNKEKGRKKQPEKRQTLKEKRVQVQKAREDRKKKAIKAARKDTNYRGPSYVKNKTFEGEKITIMCN